MEDREIINLYWSRNEAAIGQTHTKYGRLLHSISYNILSNHEDSQECVNDTYQKAWNAMPPQRPDSLTAFLGRIVRNLSINCWHKARAQKRSNGAKELLLELAECVPDKNNVEKVIEARELSEFISDWLCTLSQENRVLFLRRYWYGVPLKRLAHEYGTTPSKLGSRMYRLRQELKVTLEKEGVSI